MPSRYDYTEAFSRNIGWLSPWEQQLLRHKRAAIAGMGGVGGQHLLTLARLGVGAFRIADPDHFELANFNRQAGANLDSVGQSKVEVLKAMALKINPTLDIQCFPQGVNVDNLDPFLDGVDIYIDGLDFFAPAIRAKVFARCRELGIPAITAAPIGMSTAYLVFTADSMSFEDYFCLRDQPETRQLLHFLVGLTPQGLHRSYLVDPSTVNLGQHRGPSTGMACQLCSGVVGIEALKLLLGRGPIHAAPWYHQFDAYRGKWKRGYLWLGNRNPLQKLKIAVAAQMYSKMLQPGAVAVSPPLSKIEQILDLARWAPSGDNSQPWRFEICSATQLIIHGRDQAGEDVYDYHQGQPSLLSLGCLLESISLAASRFGDAVTWQYQADGPQRHRITVDLLAQDLPEDALLDFLPIRSVNRHPFRSTPLTQAQKRQLEAALGDAFSIRWSETLGERWQQARLCAQAADIRLNSEMATDTLRRVLDWSGPYSQTGIPAQATGVDKGTELLMRWAMQDWSRLRFLNRYLAGTLMPRLQLEIVPGLLCAAHFSISYQATTGLSRPERLLEAGRALQRFWLSATQLGLSVQPTFSPLVFAYYGKHDMSFDPDQRLLKRAKHLCGSFMAQGEDPDQVLFRGRIGVPGKRVSQSRSIRKPLDTLIIK